MMICFKILIIYKLIDMKKIFYVICFFLLVHNDIYSNKIDKQIDAARGVINRVVGTNNGNKFLLELLPVEDGFDCFEIEPSGRIDQVIIRGTSGVAICTGFNYYLKKYCNSMFSIKGCNINLPEILPTDFIKIRRKSPIKYRYMFNYCTFGYSTAFWGWTDWEKMIDWMALNGINMPLALNGQEIIWQRTFKKYGLKENDLENFFTGPAYLAWWRMGELDGWGGPLSQEWIENDRLLQHKILDRERSLGMTPVLQGFAGHVPSSFVEKNKNIKYSTMSWCDFPKVNILDWDEPLFSRIGETFIQEMIKEYGTDHFYAIDPFNEMEPKNGDLVYLKNMGRTIFEGMNSADHKSTWLLMSWVFKNPEWDHNFWKKERTKAFLEAIPNDRIILLDLHCESWEYTAWRKLDGFWKKPWIWGIIQNFGDKVNMFGGLDIINNNLKTMLNDQSRENLIGMGLFMEGLDYNPIVFEFMSDLMWSVEPIDIENWKWQYIKSRYGKMTPEIKEAWGYIYDYFYTQVSPFTGNILLGRPGFRKTDKWPKDSLVKALDLLISSSDDFKNIDAFQFDMVNLSREIFAVYAEHLLFKLSNAYFNSDIEQYRKQKDNFISFINEFDELLGTHTAFLLGKWIADAKEQATSKEEELLMEWNAKNLITLWGPKGHPGCGGLQGYAAKQWSGIFKDYSLPIWEYYLLEKEKELNGEKVDDQKLYQEIMNMEEKWTFTQSNLPTTPMNNTVDFVKKLWDKYGEDLKTGSADFISKENFKFVETKNGIAVGKKIVSTAVIKQGHEPDKAIDGKINLDEAWWGAPYPQSLIIDLEKEETVFGFHVIPYWDWERYYRYTIEISNDSKDWTEVVDMSKNTTMSTPNGHLHIFKIKYPQGFKARYVRINMLENSANEGVHLVEFKIFRGEDIN